MGADAAEFEPLHPERLTWAVMLGRWVEFAKAAVALPGDEVGSVEGGKEGGRWRASVPDVVGLQAVWFALQDLDELAVDERALGLDRAGVLIERHAGALRSRWGGGDEMPEALAELIEEAEAALAAAVAGT